MKLLYALVVSQLIVACSPQEQDFSGNWSAEVAGAGATTIVRFDLNALGSELHGTVTAGNRPPAAIVEGHISGDAITFKLVMSTGPDGGPSAYIMYEGIYRNDQIEMTSSFVNPGRDPITAEFVALRDSEE